jgi:hypothetical protein
MKVSDLPHAELAIICGAVAQLMWPISKITSVALASFALFHGILGLAHVLGWQG